MQTLDGKYQVIKELSRNGFLVAYAVAEARYKGLLYWFEVHTPEARSAFHRYRNALKRLEGLQALPKGLEISANPGRYYVFWPETPSKTPRKNQVQPWLEALKPFGYTHTDFEIGEQGGRLVLSNMHPLGGMAPPALPKTPPASPTPQPPEPTPASPTVKPKRRWNLAGWVPGLLLLILGLFSGALGVQRYLNPPSFVLPDLRGKNPSEATQAVQGMGLRIALVEGSDVGQPKDAVLAQDPAPGTQVKPGRRLELVVNNPKLGTVPTLAGRSLEDARQTLQASGYVVGTASRVASERSPGTVLASLPAAGSPLAPGKAVNLLLSQGPSTALNPPVPNLLGLSLEDAELVLSAAGWQAQVVRTASGAPANQVIGQKPSPGEALAVQGTVQLQVSVQLESRIPQNAPFAPAPPVVEPAPPPPPPEGIERRIALEVPTLPGLVGQRIRLVVQDELGERVLYDDAVTGEFLFRAESGILVRGAAVVRLYLDEQLYQEWNYPL